MKYKVGDKVMVRRNLKDGLEYGGVYCNCSMVILGGKVGTIRRVSTAGIGAYKLYEYDWWWSDEMLAPICTEKIVITSDGVTTTARKYDGKKIVKEAKAVCSKDDTFDFNVGVKLAMERLMKEDKPKLYNGKVVCVSSNSFALGYTKGKIYQFRNGRTLDDDGTTRPSKMTDAIEDFKDIERRYPGVWLEVVE